jgi:hypothetical protein
MHTKKDLSTCRMTEKQCVVSGFMQARIFLARVHRMARRLLELPYYEFLDSQIIDSFGIMVITWADA